MKSIFLVISVVLISINTHAETLKQAIDLTSSEQYEEANKVFKQLITASPKNGELYYFCGENFFAQGLEDSATAYFTKGVEIEPAQPLNYVGLGKVDWYAGKTSAAKTNFDKALAMNANTKNVKVQKEIAKCYINANTKDLTSASTLLDNASKLDPKNTETPLLYGDLFLEMGDGSKAIEQYKKAQSIDPKSCLATLRIGQLYGRSKNYPLAIEFYNNALSIDSSFAPSYRELAEIYYKAGQIERAKARYKKFLELSSNNLEARRRYASFLYLNKNYDEAINQLIQVRNADTSYNVVNRLLAFSYFESGKFAEAYTYSNLFFNRQGNEKNKLLADDYLYQGKILSKLGKDSLAVISLAKAIEVDTSKTELYTDLAAAYTKMKKFPEAIRYYELKQNTKKGLSSSDYYALGKCYYFTKNYEKADTSFGTFITLNSKVPNGFLWRAKTKTNFDPDSKQGLAKPYYEKYIERVTDKEKEKRDLIEAYSYLGYYYFLQKDNENAKVNWLKVKEIDPTNEKANKALSNGK
jgi:tetratricopeptide (TPR) repeat protein